MAYLLTYGIINQLRGNMDFQQLKLGINRLLIMNIDLTKRWLYTTKYTSILSDKPPILLFINHLKQETIRSLILDILFQVEPDNSSTKRDFDLLGELRYFETIWKLYWYQLKSEDSLEFIINLLTDAIYYKESEHFLEYVYKEEFLNDILNVLSCKNYKNIQKMIDFLDSLLQVLCYRSEKLMLLIREIKLYIHSNLDKIYSTLQYIENDSSIVFEEGKMIINDKVIPFIVPSNYPKCYKLTIKRYTFMSFFLSTDIIEKEKINLNIELIINCLEWLLLNPKNDMILSLNFKILEIIFSNFIRDKDNSYIDIISYLFIETRLVSRVKYQIIMNSRSGLNYLLAFVQFHLNAVINKLKEEGKGLNQSLLIELESCRESSFKEETIIYPKSQFYFPKSKNKFVKNNFFIKDDDFLI
ncbi:hypothetical protein K502DRAFT_326235 [Neoconidiobolus thromboides FSU 785]|nr:hypothetical protein K502DRAFT_326235 [Neoconidiobolus thromboides FSU 785]